MAFSPDGQRLITVQNPSIKAVPGEARIWDVNSGKLIGEPFLPNGLVVAVCFSPDGHNALAAVAPDQELPGAAYVLDAMTGKPTGVVLRHADGVGDARYSPDGRLIVTASDDATARVWDARSGNPVGPPLTHRRALTMAVFSPDGRRVATACGDGTARVWDAQTGAAVSPPLICDGRVECVAFSPDGLRLLTTVAHWPGDRAGPAGQVRIWELASTNRHVANLISEAELLCGSRIDQTSALVPLSPDELLERWRAIVKTVAQRSP